MKTTYVDGLKIRTSAKYFRNAETASRSVNFVPNVIRLCTRLYFAYKKGNQANFCRRKYPYHMSTLSLNSSPNVHSCSLPIQTMWKKESLQICKIEVCFCPKYSPINENGFYLERITRAQFDNLYHRIFRLQVFGWYSAHYTPNDFQQYKTQ